MNQKRDYKVTIVKVYYMAQFETAREAVARALDQDKDDGRPSEQSYTVEEVKP